MGSVKRGDNVNWISDYETTRIEEYFGPAQNLPGAIRMVDGSNWLHYETEYSWSRNVTTERWALIKNKLALALNKFIILV